MFLWRDARAGVVRAVTDRWGGVSSAPFDALNLADHVGDSPAAVDANRTRVAAALGVDPARLLFPRQCHGDTVHVVDGPWSGPPPDGDALVTTRADLALGVLVADCVPVLLSDFRAGVVAAVHAGRAGLTARIVDRALETMGALGAADVEALVGPSVCGRCYEVPEPLRDAAAAVSPVAAAVSWTGTPAVDVAAGVVDQLASRARVTWVPGCTREHADLYSYRADRETGRFAGVVLRSSRAGAASSAASTVEAR